MMPRPLRSALLADGSSDRALIHVIRWVIAQHRPAIQMAATGFRARDLKRSIREEVEATIELFAPDILFVHRDAEREDPEARRREIPDVHGRLVRVVPVRMTEAWLLFDDLAIRRAANHPNGAVVLHLPPSKRIEELPDPKSLLHEILATAADARGRRRAKRLVRDRHTMVQRVAELITDFEPLRELRAFQRFERDCRLALDSLPKGS